VTERELLAEAERLIGELRGLVGFLMRERQALLDVIEESGDLHAASARLRALRTTIGDSVHLSDEACCALCVSQPMRGIGRGAA